MRNTKVSGQTVVSKKRLFFIIAAIALFCTEVCIALFVDDSFIRPFGGDILVVILIYCFVRCFITEKYPLLSLWIFLFAVFIEVMQYVNVLELLGLSHIHLLTVIAGTSFSMVDILCYACGCVCTGVFEYFYRRHKPNGSVKVRGGTEDTRE